jgi:hypothetical protein
MTRKELPGWNILIDARRRLLAVTFLACAHVRNSKGRVIRGGKTHALRAKHANLTSRPAGYRPNRRLRC